MKFPFRLSAVVTAGFALLCVVMMFIARLQDAYVCVEIVDAYTLPSDHRYLFDTTRGIVIKDGRRSSPGYGVFAPDNQAYVYLDYVPKFNGLSSLYVQSRQASILLEKDMLPLYSNDVLGSYVRWSPDGKRIAYLWTGTDKQTHLSLVNSDGTGKQTDTIFVPKDTLFSINRLLMSAWSADGAYLAVAERGKENTGFWFWSTHPLKRLNSPFDEQALTRGVWSPTGHTFAAVAPGDQPQLILMTAGDTFSVHRIELSAADYEHAAWSPDGEYVMLSAVIAGRDDPNQRAYWQHDLYRADGMPLILGIRGNDDKQSDTVSYLSGPGINILFTGYVLTAAWKPEGHDWVFARSGGTGEDAVLDMVVLDAETGQYQTLAHSIVTDYDSSIFSRSMVTLASFDANPEVPAENRMIVPYWEDGRITVDMIDLAALNRTTIIKGAEGLTEPNSFFRNPTFWLGSNLGVVASSSGKGENRRVQLATVTIDDATVRELPFEFQGIDQFSRISDSWAVFVGKRDDGVNLYAFNFRTGDYRELLHDIGDLKVQWSAQIDPEETIAAVGYLGIQDQVSHYAIVSLKNSRQPARVIPSDGLNSFTWSPDGLKLALIQGISYKDRRLQIFDDEGTVLSVFDLSPQLSLSAWINRWTTCS